MEYSAAKGEHDRGVRRSSLMQAPDPEVPVPVDAWYCMAPACLLFSLLSFNGGKNSTRRRMRRNGDSQDRTYMTGSYWSEHGAEIAGHTLARRMSQHNTTFSIATKRAPIVSKCFTCITSYHTPAPALAFSSHGMLLAL